MDARKIYDNLIIVLMPQGFVLRVDFVSLKPWSGFSSRWHIKTFPNRGGGGGRGGPTDSHSICLFV